ncbi:hypothetical protein [Methylobacterium trifolii]|uniref:Histidine kinase n=1 Tax=Methylobacterium trifolii TaxID=1003092 RepID=A0ABQ4TVC3_9HYPH|nr:hypothetical protein [Methylobacterium trifolii]GJE59185.1 hypothetical protein MPOCJGCO_1273 [Methylobacterium trifolii]
MRRTLFKAATAAFLLCALPAAVQAKTFELPDETPLVTIDLPNAWSPEEIDKGAQATSPDATIYVAFEISNLKNTEKAVVDAVKFLADSGVKIDPSTQKKLETKINGLDVVDINWDAVDKDGPTKVSLSIIILSPTKIGVLTYWGSPAGEKKYAAQLKGIADSIQPLGR